MIEKSICIKHHHKL